MAQNRQIAFIYCRLYNLLFKFKKRMPKILQMTVAQNRNFLNKSIDNLLRVDVPKIM